MDKERVKRELNDILWDEYVFTDTYEDKYFLTKEIKSKFPELTEAKITAAIEAVNKEINAPRRTFRFIEALAGKL